MLLRAVLLSLSLVLTHLPQESGCGRCGHRGVVACTRHGAEGLALEQEVRFCSEAAACDDCGGALLVDCKRCAGGPGSAALLARRAEIDAWLAADPLRAHFERPVRAAVTDHFELVLDLEPMKEGRKTVDGHALLHRVAQDVEHVAGRIAEHYALEPGAYPSRMRMWMWERQDDHASAMQRFMNTVTRGDFKLLGRTPVLSVWREPGLFDTVEGVRSLFAHNAGHMLLSNLYRELWVGDLGGGWLDAGAGHWYEYERMGRSVQYCIEESTVPQTYHGGEWRAPLRKRLEGEGDTFLLGTLLPKNTGAMTLSEQALCWSFYDWLVAEHTAALPTLLHGLKDRKPARELLTETLGADLFELERRWRAWVSEVYPLRGDAPRARDGASSRTP